jgi:HSP20 family protein
MDKFTKIYYIHGKVNKSVEDILKSFYKYNEYNNPTSPHMDIVIKNNVVNIYVDLPGVGIEDFKVYLIENKVIIEGEKAETAVNEKRNYLLMEREFFPFKKIVELPKIFNLKNGTANLKDGVLHIKLEYN